jgi:hypothetical protein
MTHCCTCAHWHAFDPSEHHECWEERNSFGLCERIHGTRALWLDPTEDEIVERTDLAAIEDLSDHAFLRTAGYFGCVLWEQKS